MKYRSVRQGSRFGPIGVIVRRFREENMAQTAAALAFTTLLALVPLVTVVVAMSSLIPFLDTLLQRLDALLIETLLPKGAGGTIAGYLGRFSQKAQQLTWTGLGFVALTALMLMHTIERTFNHLWQVEPRPFLQRLRRYALAMVVWPIALGAITAFITYALTLSLGFVDESTATRRTLFKWAYVALMGIFFAYIYHAVPNARVSRVGAVSGGVFATLAIALMQKGFEVYLSSFGTFKSIYGAFAVAPIFLVWLHFSWAVVLIGALIAATPWGSAPRRTSRYGNSAR